MLGGAMRRVARPLMARKQREGEGPSPKISSKSPPSDLTPQWCYRLMTEPHIGTWPCGGRGISDGNQSTRLVILESEFQTAYDQAGRREDGRFGFSDFAAKGRQLETRATFLPGGWKRGLQAGSTYVLSYPLSAHF